MLSPGLTMQGLAGPIDETYLSLSDEDDNTSEDPKRLPYSEEKDLSTSDSNISDLGLQQVLSSRNHMIQDLLAQIQQRNELLLHRPPSPIM